MLLLFICIYLTFYLSYDPNSSAGIDDPTGGFIYLFIYLSNRTILLILFIYNFSFTYLMVLRQNILYKMLFIQVFYVLLW